jgi:hypothetical protein
MAASPVSLERALDIATDQLLIFLSERARNGSAVLQLRNELERAGPFSVLTRVVDAVGDGTVAARADRALRWFDVDPMQKWNDSRTCRGETCRLLATFLRINKALE